MVTIAALASLSCSCGGAGSGLPSDPLERGKAALDQGRVPVAVESITAHIQKSPNDGAAHRLLAQAHARQGDYARAIQALESALERGADDGATRALLGDLHYALGHYEDAREAYQKALLGGVEALEIAVRLADCETQLKRPKDALLRLDAALEKHGGSPVLYIARARTLRRMAKMHEAVEAYRKATELDEKDPTPLAEMGLLYEALDFPERAQVAYEKALIVAPEHVDTLAGLGRVLVQAGRTVDAIPILTRAARLIPDSSTVHNNLGVAYSQSGMSAEAEGAFRKALSIDDGVAAIHSNLAEACYLQGKLLETESSLRTALKLAPDRVRDQEALRRVAVMRVSLELRCRLGKIPTPDALRAAMEQRWSSEGWAAGSYKEPLAAVLADEGAMALLDREMQRCAAPGTHR